MSALGIVPDMGSSWFLPRLIGSGRATAMTLLGHRVSAEQAAAWGFVNRVLPPEGLLDAARALALDMLSTLPEMLTRYKAVINDGFALAFGEGMALEQSRAREFNVRVAADDVEQRREAVRQRNRSRD